jgi:predicted DNA-binding transcriptional regulator AlpA
MAEGCTEPLLGSPASMGRKVDLADLLDAAGVAEMIGLAQRQSVRLYRHRYPDFPAPVLELGGGRCLVWLRSDIKAWLVRRAKRSAAGPGAS